MTQHGPGPSALVCDSLASVNDIFTPCEGLPIEVLSQIFSSLSYQDLRSARMVCYRWYIASLDPKLTDREKIVIECLEGKQGIPLETMHQLRDNKRECVHLEIKGSAIEWCDEYFFSQVGHKLRSLNLWPTIGSKEDLFKALHHCPNLKYLSIRIENIFFSLIGVSTISQWTFPDLLKLERLELNGISLYNLGILQIMLLTTPNLQSIVLRRKALKSLDYRAFVDVMDCLRQNEDRVFDLSLNFLDDCSLSILLKKRCDNVVRPNVLLRVLYTQITPQSLFGLYLYQETLEELVLGSRVKVSNGMLASISTNCVNLKKLDCNMQWVNALPSISELVKLKSLTLRMMFHLNDRSLIQSLCLEVNNTLTEVGLMDMRLVSPRFIVEFARTHPAVTSLNLKYCAGLNDSSIQAIFKYQTSLEVLRIPLCQRVTDCGLRGLRIHSTSWGFHELENPTGHSIQRLKGLRLLDLRGLETPLHILETVTFPLLRDVGLGHTPISLIVLEQFLENHPDIRNLDVSRLFMNDSRLRKIVGKLPQLENIVIQNCHGLTQDDAKKFLSGRSISCSSDLWT